ncbi:MAG: rhodanese-like domain-containing protein, partial [Gammaproteobacteria bacterium]
MRVTELKALLDAGEEVIVVDSRSLESYEARHIVGAISMPLPEVDER